MEPWKSTMLQCWGKSYIYEWMMNELCINNIALCINVVHPKRFTIMGGGGLSSTTTSVQHPLVCELKNNNYMHLQWLLSKIQTIISIFLVYFTYFKY